MKKRKHSKGLQIQSTDSSDDEGRIHGEQLAHGKYKAQRRYGRAFSKSSDAFQSPKVRS